MPDSLSYVDLTDRLRAGDEDAAARVFELYTQRLIDLARQRLQDRLHDRNDAGALLHSVFESFTRRQPADTSALSDWNSLWTIPVMLTLRKCGRKVPGVPPRDPEITPGPLAEAATDGEIAREPSTEEAARLVETVEELQRGFDTEDRQIVVLSLQGLKPAAVSRELQLTERRVYRVLERFRSRLRQLRDAP